MDLEETRREGFFPRALVSMVLLLNDVLQELVTQLDVLCATTQARLSTRLARQLTRLTQCEDSLRAATLATRQRVGDLQRECDGLTRELEDTRATHKKLVARSQRERQDRSEEKEWLAALWPEHAVLPTLLKPYAPEPPSSTAPRFVSHMEAQDERERLLALVERRVARERVLQCIDAAAQWKVVVVAPSTTPEGEYVAAQTFFQNRETGESVWEAPMEMLYEPPSHWDRHKMDWKDGYALDNFYPPKPKDAAPTDEATARAPPSGRVILEPVPIPTSITPPKAPEKPSKGGADDDDDEDDDDDDDVDEEQDDEKPVPTNRTRPTARTDRSGDDDDGEPPDPEALRAELQAAFDHAKALHEQLTRASAQQRSLALQLLNATRDSFEREKETLAKEDEAVKDAERQRRKAQKEEEIAAQAAAQAAERKALDKALQPKIGRGTVAKKDLTLAKDDEQLEQELAAFAVAQRRDRLYLAAPLASDARVKFRGQFDDEFVHMKHMEQQQLELEQTEFDLLEKTALRLEEATKRCEELTQLLEKAEITQQDVVAELERLPQQIAALEEPEAPPSEPRPGEDVLARAKERYIVAEEDDTTASGRVDDDDDDAKEEEAKSKDEASVKPGEGGEEEEEEEDEEEEEEEEEAEDEATTTPPAIPAKVELDPEAVARDEAELKQLRQAVELDKRWREWELREVLRLEDLAAAYDRFQALQTMQRQLVVDVALFESDRAFFEQLVAREKQANELLWGIQAKAQVERARFLMERAAREESLFQVEDEYEALRLRLEDARRLPRQAQNPLEKLQLVDESKRQAEQLQLELEQLRTRFEKEQQAKQLQVELETRFSEYSLAKLREEAALFAEKQALWDLNGALHDELVATRTTLDALYATLQGDTVAASEQNQTRGLYDDTSALFQEKLQRLEAARQFLLLCYTREERWRTLAAVALIKDTTSDAWITQAQRERQEETLTTLQRQHDAELLALRKEIKLLTKVKQLLQSDIAERDAKLEALRGEYQRSSEAVRLETEQIILGLKEHLQHEQDARREERERAQRDRARLLGDHETLSAELQRKIVELERQREQQGHWLTAARRELHAQRVANEALLVGYQSLEKRRATETNDMRFRIGAQIAKINGIEMWNLSLKLQAREAHAERVRVQRDIERLVAHHKQQQRLLRLANWKHRVAAQAVLTDVDTLFQFFADGLALLAGSSPAANDALRRNGGIDVLAALARHCGQPAIRVLSARALGELAWNANATPRALGWRAKKCWFSYAQRLSTRVLDDLAARGLEFDSAAGEDTSEMNWLADPVAVGGESEISTHGETKKLRFLRAWNARDEATHPDENLANQEYIGLAPSVLKTLLDLCKPPPVASDESVQIQRNALRSLALIVMNTRNTAIVGRLDGCIPLLVGLIRETHATTTDDTAVVRHAVHALANLAFENAYNQQQICLAGAVPRLLAHAATCHDDVDLLLASVEALTHLTYAHRAACEAVFDAGGLAVLTSLCHSFRIHDAIDLDVFERVQTRAAEVIANVITMLNGDPAGPLDSQQQDGDNQGDQAIERDIASAILAASRADAKAKDDARPGVATFVLMCASCTRDVAFHGALVLGSIAQHDDIRAAIGACGGLDALFLLASHEHDVPMVAQATWALANATWNRENQYRVARYLDALYALATFHHSHSSSTTDNQPETSEDESELVRQIREHALCVLANALFYNEANRQLVGAHAAWMALLQHHCQATPSQPSLNVASLEHAARALCALSYSDTLALAMGGHDTSSSLAPARAVDALALFVKLCAHRESVVVQQHGLFGIINMCLHDANKAKLLAVPHGIETLVNLSGSTDRALCDPAIEALDLLADVRSAQLALAGSSPAALVSPSTMSALAASDLKKLIEMLQDTAGATPAIVAMACDAIADEVWKRPSAKVRLRNERGLDALLALCVDPQSAVAPHRRALLSCLWALRNSVADNARNQDYVGALGGVPKLVALYDRHKQHDEVVEAVLAVAIALVMTHPRNSQELVQHGVDVLLALADGVEVDEEEEEEETRREHATAASSTASHSPSKKSSSRRSAAQLMADGKKAPSKENRALAKELLLLLAPYNVPSSSTGLLPPLTKASTTQGPGSPDKHRVASKKPLHVATASHLPLLAGAGSSPLAASVSPTKRHAARGSNN